MIHSGPGQKIFKKSRPKKLVKSNKSILRKNFFDQNPFFAIAKMAKNLFFLTGQKFKNAISRNFTYLSWKTLKNFFCPIDLFDFTIFFLDF